MSTKATGFPFILTWIIYASPEEVFNALAMPEIIAEWTGDEAVLEPRINGAFAMFGGWVKGNVLAFEPGKKLSYSWKPDEWNKKAEASIVTYLFEKDIAGTKITLTHEGFPSIKESDSHKSGWVDNVFEPLNDYFVMR
ncbi:MAG: SRPBCC domain-containing protein [Bacteroidia bacterium]